MFRFSIQNTNNQRHTEAARKGEASHPEEQMVEGEESSAVRCKLLKTNQTNISNSALEFYNMRAETKLYLKLMPKSIWKR